MPEERALPLKHGYPFPDARPRLQAVATSGDVEVLMISRFYLQQLIGDLCYSIVNKWTRGRIQRDPRPA